MPRVLLVTLALAVSLLSTAGAAPRPHRVCVPVFIEGAGTVQICAPAHRR